MGPRSVPGSGAQLFKLLWNRSLERPFDWITDAVTTLQANPRFFAANPDLVDHPGLSEQTALWFEDPYWINRSFSDQCFLGATARYAAPIYEEWNEASNRYPMSSVGRIFEARVDAYMQNRELYRMTDSRIRYKHISHDTPGETYVKPYVWQRAVTLVKYRLPRAGRKLAAAARSRRDHAAMR